MITLPEVSNCMFVHYSCDLFQRSECVFAIGIRADEKTEIWTATNEQEEVSAIQNLYRYLVDNPNRVIINWKMDEYQFGPDHLTRRYKQLSGSDLPEIKNEWLNLSSYLWNKYGEYAPHPRLRNLCEMNEIFLYGYHIDPENYNTDQAKKHKVATHVSAIERIHFKECRETLKVNRSPTGIGTGFGEYIKRGKDEILIPFLVNEYQGQRPRLFGFMLFALHSLDLIDNPTGLGDTDLYEAICATFGVDWTRQALTDNINKLNKADTNKEIKIKQHAKRIADFLNSRPVV